MRAGKEERAMKRYNEKGTALIFAMIFVLVLSVMAVSLMFLSQSETWASLNYRMMTQTRYGAEASVNATANYLMNPPGCVGCYVPPATFAGMNPNSANPVTDPGGNPIVLSSIYGQPSNYPDAGTVGTFSAATTSMVQAPSGPHMTNNPVVNYTASATLLSMAQVTPFGQTTPVMVQTWQITARGDMPYTRNAETEVSAILDQPIYPAFSYAAFAMSNGCGALNFGGGGTTNSYDSGTLSVVGGVATPPASFNNYGGDVGTNGNQTDAGSQTQVNGTLSTPNIGFGVCTANNVTALTANSSTQVTGGLVEMSAPLNLPPPVIPPPGTVNINNTTTLPQCNPTCSYNYGDISLSGKDVLTLTPGIYNINSISESGQSLVQIAPDPVTGLYGPVILNVTGNNQSTPIDLTGQGFANPTLDPALFQINYAGTGQVNLVGNGQGAAVVYAPNATAKFAGNGDFYGSVMVGHLTDFGQAAIHYDLSLRRKLYTIGNWTLSSFSWNKF
jgi:type IV pilus assembly PilX-like protein